MRLFPMLIVLAVASFGLEACEDADDGPPAETAEPSATPAPEPAALLERSDAAMAQVIRVTVEEAAWPHRAEYGEPWVQTAWYEPDTSWFAAEAPDGRLECTERGPERPFTQRALGGVFGSGPTMGATAPERFELAEGELDGLEVWILTYRYRAPSIEGPFEVRRTDWIAKSGNRLYRSEYEQFDPFGFRGILVSVFRYHEERTELCDWPQQTPAEELRPLTEPELDPEE